MANEYLVRTPTVTSNQRCWTWSGWIRRSVLSNVTANQNILRIPAGSATGGDCGIRFDGDAFRVFINGGTTADLRTASLIRDPNSWIHLHVTYNSSAVNSNGRLRLFINGINQLSYSTETYPSLNAVSAMCGIGTTSYIGGLIGSATVGSGLAAATEFLNAEIADFFFVDGLAITPDQFGFYKERRGYISAGAGATYINDFRAGQWVPKTPRAVISYITNAGGFGPNGYYLPLNDSANPGADFHTTPNSIFTLNENLQQPRVSIAQTGDLLSPLGAYANVLRRDPLAANIVLAAPMVFGASGGGYQDYSGLLKGGVSKSPAAFQNSPVSFASTSIYYGSSGYFQGTTGSYVTYGAHGDFQFGTTDFTIEFWANPQRRNPATQECLLTIGLPVQINRNVNNEITVQLSANNSTFWVNAPIGIAVTNQWTHIAVSKKGSNLYGFVNGVCGLAVTNASTIFNNPLNPVNLVIGDYAPNIGQFPYQGYLQDLRIYNTAKYVNGFDVPKSWGSININPSVGFSTWRANGSFACNVPTNPYAALNPIANSNPISNVSIGYSFSNTSAFWSNNANVTAAIANIGVNTGSWYFEARMTNLGTSGEMYVGVSSAVGVSSVIAIANRGLVPAVGIQSAAVFGTRSSFIQGDVVGVAFSFTNGRPSIINFYQNGVEITPPNTLYGSISTTGFVGCGTADGLFYPAVSAGQNAIWDLNFGDNPTFGGVLPLQIFANNQAAGFPDINGQGTFRYPPPVGYLALCKNNLITVTPQLNTTLQNPGNHFRTVLYTGDATQTKNIVGVGFTADLIWIKARGATAHHRLFDSVRGPIAALYSSQANAETIETGSLTSFNLDGFSLGNDSNNGVNQSGTQYVAWCWKAGAGTTSVNATDGTIATGISTNLAAGFSVVTYTGNNTANATIGHGLQRPAAFALIKNRDGANNWAVYHKNAARPDPFLADLISNPGPRYTLNIGSLTSGYLSLNSTAASAAYTMDGQTNALNARYIAYVWAEIEGYSRFHEYLGNGNADGPMVTLGFKPALLIIKNATASGSWRIFDSSRNPINPTDVTLVADGTAVETASAANITVDFLSNGFKVRSTDSSLNTLLNRYIYAAWAESPYVHANAK